MKIEAGKRYVRRDGEITAALVPNDERYPFRDGRGELGSAQAWTSDGSYWYDGDSSEYDIVSEYVEPSPAYTFANEPGYPHPAGDVKFSAGGTYVEPRTDGEAGYGPRDTVGAGIGDPIPCDVYDTAALDALAEVRRAKTMWPNPANSAHEQFAVLDEEIDELLDASGFTLVQILHGRGKLWNHVKVNQKRRDLVAMRKEAIQVAAMALRFAAECCDETVGRK